MATSIPDRMPDSDLVYQCAAPDWALGAPLGNGHVGVALWGDGSPLCLTLDRDDVWDLRNPRTYDDEYRWDVLGELARAGRMDRVKEILDRNLSDYRAVPPTKLPIGRMEITCAGAGGTFHGRLSLTEASFRGEAGAVAFEAFVPAEEPLFIVQFDGRPEIAVRVRGLRDLNPEQADKLDLPALTEGADGAVSWVRQEFPTGAAAVVAWQMIECDGGTALVGTIATTSELSCDPPGDPIATATARLRDAAGRYEAIRDAHREWWERFWARSSVSLPDCRLETLWRYGLYKLASSSRKGHLPANLQGLWVTDGVLPPWRGDYHLNMNVQETYWPVYTANHLGLAEPLYDWVDRITPAVRERTQQIFGFDGVRMETALAADGTPVPGWSTVQYWPGAAAWVAHHYWLQWKYSCDVEFLRERAYPFMKLCAAFWLGYLEPDDGGTLHVPLSHSPEWHGDGASAWARDPNVDLALVRNLFAWLAEASELLGVDDDDRRRWLDARAKLQPYLLDGNGGLMLMDGAEYSESHRHPSHLMPVFPMDEVTIEGGDEDRRVIDQSMHALEARGTGEWTGWSFPYVALIASRAGRKNMAAYMLKLFADSFIMPNGFHVNGDWRKNGVSLYHYRPYTMEAECAASAAVSDLLLQSWGGKIRLFPSLPDRMADAGFTGFLAEGGIEVDAERRDGKAVEVALRGPRGAVIALVGCSAEMRWNGCASATYEGGSWRLTIGESGGVTGSLAGAGVVAMAPHDERDRNPLGLRPQDLQSFLECE